MKILFITSDCEDYLSDGLLIGLRKLHGADCIDYPKKDILYSHSSQEAGARIRGKGFTLYTTHLCDLDINRSFIEQRLKNNEFDLVIFSDIWRHYGVFVQWYPFLDSPKTIICDGADTPQVYPYAGRWWRRPSQWFVPRAHEKFLYYKREWTEKSQFSLISRIVPKSFRSILPAAKNLRRVSFSIPDEKVLSRVTSKSKDFATHCVDPEVAERFPSCKTGYAFESESEYYADLQTSLFAITTKRAGWDCVRHYEIAANGCIPCFKKPESKASNLCTPWTGRWTKLHSLLKSFRSLRPSKVSLGRTDQPNSVSRTRLG